MENKMLTVPLSEAREQIERFENSIKTSTTTSHNLSLDWRGGRCVLLIRWQGKIFMRYITRQALINWARILSGHIEGEDDSETTSVTVRIAKTLSAPPPKILPAITEFVRTFNALVGLGPNIPVTVVTAQDFHSPHRVAIAILSEKYSYISVTKAIDTWLTTISPDKQYFASLGFDYANLSIYIWEGELKQGTAVISMYNGYTGDRAFRVVPSIRYGEDWIAISPLSAKMYHRGYVDRRMHPVITQITPETLNWAAEVWQKATTTPIKDREEAKRIVGERFGKTFAKALQYDNTVANLVASCIPVAKKKHGALSPLVLGEILELLLK